MIDRRDEAAGTLCAMMIAISEAAANHQQTCELCQSLPVTLDDDDNFLTFMTEKTCCTAARPVKRWDIVVSTFVARSLSGGGGFGGVAATCNASVVARINGILRIENIFGSWKCPGSVLATALIYMLCCTLGLYWIWRTVSHNRRLLYCILVVVSLPFSCYDSPGVKFLSSDGDDHGPMDPDNTAVNPALVVCTRQSSMPNVAHIGFVVF